jgi:DNA-binding MarR family transcriptional regulator
MDTWSTDELREMIASLNSEVTRRGAELERVAEAAVLEALDGFMSRHRAGVRDELNRIGFRAPTFAAALERLEARGLVEIEKDITPKNRAHVKLTASGEKALRRLRGDSS